MATPLHEPDSDGIFVGGWGNWQYVYEPKLLPLPTQATVEHAHGIIIYDNRLIITYQDSVNTSRCLLQWPSLQNLTVMPDFIGPGEALCSGVPHGLRLSLEYENEASIVRPYLYHANNEQTLHKTTLDGEIVWSRHGRPGRHTIDGGVVEPDREELPYKPTWMATSSSWFSPYVYLADGYGSNRIFILFKANGTLVTTNSTNGQAIFGGMGSKHGQFQTCHAIAWDERVHQWVVCDRENHRLEYFEPTDGTITSSASASAITFDYSHTVSHEPYLQRPCNIRIQATDGMAIVPALEGTVGILDPDNNLVSLVNVSAVLGEHYGFWHPHDAHFAPGTNGDFILVTWNPGRIGYFRRVGRYAETKPTEASTTR